MRIVITLVMKKNRSLPAKFLQDDNRIPEKLEKMLNFNEIRAKKDNLNPF